jgi:hypothetical protein
MYNLLAFVCAAIGGVVIYFTHDVGLATIAYMMWLGFMILGKLDEIKGRMK